jgi:linoleoyl-CoA desaturase
MVQRTILRLAFPGGKVRPKPGPYRPEDGEPFSSSNGRPSQRRPDAGGSGTSGPEQADEGVRFEMPPAD